MFCKIGIEEESECKKCCKYCIRKCEKRCVFDKFDNEIECDNKVVNEQFKK